MSKRIIITGATGLIGKPLCARLTQRGDEVTIFTRSAAKTKFPFPLRIVEWDYHKPEQWKKYLEKQDAVVHLAGVNLFSRRWTDKVKRDILESRQVSTYNLSKTLNSLNNKPEVFITASGIGYYGETGEAEVKESNPPGEDFLALICKEWERNAVFVEKSGIRRVSMRTGVVLSTQEGALKQMITPFKFFVGGPLGTGRQWFSWIHLSDVVDGYIFAIDNNQLTGSVNLSSPNPVRMKEFAQTLGKVLNRPSFFKVPSFALKIIAGEAGEVVTFSQKIIPEKLIRSEFQFGYPTLKESLNNLLK